MSPPAPVTRRSAARTVALLVGGVALVVATALAQRAASRARVDSGGGDAVAFLPRTSVLRAIAFGHPEAMADVLYLRGIGYYATQYQQRKDTDWLRRHVDTINALDPAFRAPYLFGARAALFHGGATTEEDVRLSIHFLEQGLARFPSDWEMAFSLGCNWLFELRAKDDAERAQNRREGGRWIRRAALSGGGPPWLASLAARIMSEEGQAEAALRYLEEAYLTATDEKTRDEIGRLLAAKRVKGLEQLGRARAELVDAWRKHLPYGPADLYVLLGPPPPARLDPAWLARDPLDVPDALEGPARPAPDDDARGAEDPADGPRP